MKSRLDARIVELGLVNSRSQAEGYIKLGQAKVDGQVATKAGFLVDNKARIELTAKEQYVSRGGLKLASVAGALKLDFKDKVVLDVGSSTGGFSDYALQHDARKVIAVDVGREQLHASLRGHPRLELHEKTDIRDFMTNDSIDIVLIDVSFISLRQVLPTVAKLSSPQTQIVAMVKPQFETDQGQLKHKGVVKNDKLRREILKQFENWAQTRFITLAKADSAVRGALGNQERFYLLQKA